MSPETRDTEELAEGTLISHLLELRGRLLRSMIAILIVFLPLAMFSNELFTIVAQPLIDKLPEGNSLIATSVVAPFMTPLKLALVASIFIAMPYVLYQVWAFIAPGLYRHEKRFALPLFASSVFLFYAGTAFAYFIVFPLMFKFLTMTTPVGVKMMTDISSYLDFVVLLFFAFGVAFETPVATVLLVASGLVSITTLKKNRGYVLLGIFVVAAFLTPPDAISQTAMAVPMYLLYEVGSCWGHSCSRTGWRGSPRRGRRTQGSNERYAVVADPDLIAW
jgi:sec-independent protein translocase protein TatC